MSGPAIEVRALRKSFNDHVVVDNVSFTVPRGAVTAFIGGNGSGKTTVIRMILGLTVPDAGEARVDGRPYGELAEPRGSVGAVLNRLGGHPGLTGRQHLRFLASGAGLGDPQIDQVLVHVGLIDAADRKLGEYSTGMRQRLALAGAELFEPGILILDEPASGLDRQAMAWLRDLLRKKADAGVAVFLATHQMAELSSIVDRVVTIEQGRVSRQDSAAVRP